MWGMGWLVAALASMVVAGAEAQSEMSGYTPNRVYDSHAKKFIDFEAMAARLTLMNVVLVGEEHDDPATHRMELALLESIGRRRDSVVLSLEMFERDAQFHLDEYLAGSLAEPDFLARTRPWPRYQTDYRGLVEFAKARSWPVVAANSPRPFASAVARGGFAALDTIPEKARAWIAADRECPTDDDYGKAFVAEMKGPSAHGGGSVEDLDARIARMFLAQCLKDETMAESVVRAASSGRLVVHYTGSFHSDYKRGTAQRVHRRNDDLKIAVISMRPVDNLDLLEPKPDRKRGDYLVFVLKPPVKPVTAASVPAGGENLDLGKRDTP